MFNDPPRDTPFKSWEIPTIDHGHTNMYRGWYDVQGCGRCLDYCRWVGDKRDGYANPRKQLTKGDSWFSCRLAGTFEDKTEPGRFKTFEGVHSCGWDKRG